jgi:hypothetical protein
MSKKNQNHSQSYVTAEDKTVIPSWCQVFPGTHDQLCYVLFVWSSISEDSASRSIVGKIPILRLCIFSCFPLVYAEGVGLKVKKFTKQKEKAKETRGAGFDSLILQIDANNNLL